MGRRNRKGQKRGQRKLDKRQWFQCRRKIGHTEKATAHAHRRQLEAKGETDLNVYLCPWCKKYHVGHKR